MILQGYQLHQIAIDEEILLNLQTTLKSNWNQPQKQSESYITNTCPNKKSNFDGTQAISWTTFATKICVHHLIQTTKYPTVREN